jgi:hypothetical protein
MGAWGSGNFENDTALDWLEDINNNDVKAQVRQALGRVVKAKKGTLLNSDSCCIALAAAEIVAASVGAPSEPEVRELLAQLEAPFETADIEMAIAAAARIDESSDLQQLFDGRGRYEAWHDVVANLILQLKGAISRR